MFQWFFNLFGNRQNGHASSNGEMLHGKVKWFNNQKGYGFIEMAPGKDIFVHYSSIKSRGFKTLAEGQRVQFSIANGPKGKHAANVILVSKH